MIRDFSCLLCLILFLLSNTIQIVSILQDSHLHTQSYSNEDDWKQLDPTYLETLWQYRASVRLFQVDISLFTSFAWFSLVMPVTQVAFLLSKGGTRLMGLHISIVALVIGGAMAELVSHMMTIGMMGALRWMVKDFNLMDWDVHQTSEDGVGLRVVELLYVMGKGLILWVDNFEWLALAAITFFISLSVKQEKHDHPPPTFSSYFGVLSAIITVVSFVNFAANVFQISHHTTWVPLTLTMMSINAFLLLPLWLWNLSSAIPAAKARYEVSQTEENGEEVELTAIS